MIKLMEHIEYIYEPIPTLDGQHKYYVWLADGIWRVLSNGEPLLRTPSSMFALDFITELDCDLEVFELLLKGVVAVEAVTHIQALKLCEELVGRTVINEAMVGVEQMITQVKEVMDKARRPKLEVVK